MIHDLADENVESFIVSFRNFKAGYQGLKLGKKEVSSSIVETMPEILDKIVSDMLDPTQPFQHDEESKYTTF